MALTAKKVYAILKHQISDMQAKLNSPVRYRGTVATADLLPLNPDIGDMYNIESKSVYGEAGMNVAWNGVVWDTMGAPIDMSLYFTKEEAEAVIQRLVTEYFEKNPVKPGATTEQAQQIEQNKTDIASLQTETNSLKEDISTKITKFYASSQGETHLADSDNGKIQDMMVYGKSEQKQYSGKNLINGVHLSFLGNAIIFDIDKVIVNGTLSEELDASFSRIQLKAGTYTLSSSFNCISKIGINPNFGILNVGNKFKTFTISEDMEINLVVIVPSGSHNSIDYIMLNEGSDALPWEPYTGGQPSPSPDYPQEIKSVVNPTVKVCGKNLYTYHDSISNFAGIKIIRDGSNITLDGTANANGPEDTNKVLKNVFLKKGTYTLSYNIESGSKTLVGDNLFRISLNSPLIEASIQVFIVGTNNAVTFTLNKDAYASVICRVNSGSVYSNCKFNIQIEVGSTQTAYEPYHEQTVTLPYALNAISVSSGGNVTIDGQQYIADYVDVERGKLVRMVGNINFDNIRYNFTNNTAYFTPSDLGYELSNNVFTGSYVYNNQAIMFNALSRVNVALSEMKDETWKISDMLYIKNSSLGSKAEYLSWFNEIGLIGMIMLAEPEEINLTPEEIAAFKALATYYPTTNISINSEQLDGYTVFNYPISMQNGWNYVKQQIGDTREYIYDMYARTQDTDLQAAEAYVNSEYAVALTELEV